MSTVDHFEYRFHGGSNDGKVVVHPDFEQYIRLPNVSVYDPAFDRPGLPMEVYWATEREPIDERGVVVVNMELFKLIH